MPKKKFHARGKTLVKTTSTTRWHQNELLKATILELDTFLGMMNDISVPTLKALSEILQKLLLSLRKKQGDYCAEKEREMRHERSLRVLETMKKCKSVYQATRGTKEQRLGRVKQHLQDFSMELVREEASFTTSSTKQDMRLRNERNVLRGSGGGRSRVQKRSTDLSIITTDYWTRPGCMMGVIEKMNE